MNPDTLIIVGVLLLVGIVLFLRHNPKAMEDISASLHARISDLTRQPITVNVTQPAPIVAAPVLPQPEPAPARPGATATVPTPSPPPAPVQPVVTPSPATAAPEPSSFEQLVAQGLDLMAILTRMGRALTPAERLYAAQHNVPGTQPVTAPVSPDPTPVPTEDRSSGVIDRVGGVRYWRGSAGQQVTFPVMAPAGSTINVNCLGEAPEVGPRVTGFTFWLKGATGDLTPPTEFIAQGVATITITPEMGQVYACAIPSTTGAGYFELMSVTR